MPFTPFKEGLERLYDTGNVCITLGQLYRYMVTNGFRYNTLSIAPNTYFVPSSETPRQRMSVLAIVGSLVKDLTTTYGRGQTIPI